LEAVAGAGGTIAETISGEYYAGEEISISAVANGGYEFTGWTSSSGGSFTSTTSNDTIFVMPENDVVITANFRAKSNDDNTGGTGGGGGTPSTNNSTISSNNVIFDASDVQDVTVTLTLNGKTLKAIKNGDYILKEGTDYTVNSNTVTIKASYLSTLLAGDQIITFEMSGGTNPKLTLTITDTIPLQETALVYTVMKPTKVAEAQVVALKTRNSLILSGEEKDFPAVNIDDYNWLKLRDVAMLLTKSLKQFSLSYDPVTRIIDITTDSEYQPLGDELFDNLQEPITATAISQRLRMDGVFIEVAAYNIKGYNYLHLRDIAILLDFAVDYDDSGGKILLDLAKPYWE